MSAHGAGSWQYLCCILHEECNYKCIIHIKSCRLSFQMASANRASLERVGSRAKRMRFREPTERRLCREQDRDIRHAVGNIRDVRSVLRGLGSTANPYWRVRLAQGKLFAAGRLPA